MMKINAMNMSNPLKWIGILMLVLCLLIPQYSTTPNKALAADLPIGIYDGPGTWAEGKTAIKNFLDSKGYSWILVSPAHINGTMDMPATIRLLWVPGGYAGDYNTSITNNGDNKIRAFVNGGGKMIGTCAGQYFVSSKITWEGINYFYTLDLFLGRVTGAIDSIAPWPGYANTQIDLDPTHPMNSGHPDSLTMAYYGGGTITADAGQNKAWVGSFNSGGGKGIATFTYGAGDVLFMGPHPEVGLNEDDTWNVTGGATSQWDWLGSAVDWLLAS